MDASSTQNAYAFLLFCLLGAALAVVWCVLRAVRAQMREKGALSILIEALFGVLCAVCVKLLALGVYWGEVRGFMLIGAALGFWVIYETVGRLLTFLIGAMLHAAVRFLLRPLGRAVCWFGRLLRKICIFPVHLVEKTAHTVKNALKSVHRFVYNKTNAKHTAKGRKQTKHGVVKPNAGNQTGKRKEKYTQFPACAGHSGVLPVYARSSHQPANADKKPKRKAAGHAAGNSSAGN